MQESIMEYQDPVKIARYIDSEFNEMVFLHSSMQKEYSGRFSYIAFEANNIISEYKDLDNIEGKYFGYLGYDLKNDFEKLSIDKDLFIKLPKLLLIKFKYLICFDHQKKQITKNFNFDINSKNSVQSHLEISKLKSNMSKKEYIANVEKIKSRIKNGDIYQANLTRKFYGYISGNYFELFNNLATISPSPYSSYIKYKNYTIISSSPEQFLKIENNNAESRPIKGSAARYLSKKEDEESKNNLINSIKDRTENLMIVDLVRNDFARGSEPNSVKVDNLFQVSSYDTIHHMASTISSKVNCTIAEFIKNCFPPGSMTGAPKIKAMEICSEIEQYKRGVYSGAIGWLEKDSADLSVVIRTIIIEDNKFEFQVGGAIIDESDPIKEWEETLFKASAICKVLGIDKLDF